MSLRGFPVQQFRTSDGLRLVGEAGGNPHAPTVVLLHGGGQTRHSWAGAMQALIDAGYQVVNYDARGHGESDWSDEGAYSFDVRAGDLQAVTDYFCGPVAYVGASMGGVTAMQAVTRGAKPAAVVLVDIVPKPEVEGIRRIRNFMTRHPEGFASLEEAADAVAEYNPHRPRPESPRGLLRNLREDADGRLRWHWDPKIVPDDLDAELAQMQQAIDGLRRNQDVPALLVRGLHSDVVSRASVEEFKRLIPRLDVVDVSGAGHMVAGDDNDAFNDAVIDYLARQLPLDRDGDEC